MPRPRPPYPPQFRGRIVELARAVRSVRRVGRGVRLPRPDLRSWIKEADVEDGVRSDGTTAAEREELRELRRKLRCLRQERDILAKAAWFAREAGEVPEKSSRS